MHMYFAETQTRRRPIMHMYFAETQTNPRAETQTGETSTGGTDRRAVQCRATPTVSECRDVPRPQCQVPRPRRECRDRPVIPNAEQIGERPAVGGSQCRGHGIRHPAQIHMQGAPRHELPATQVVGIRHRVNHQNFWSVGSPVIISVYVL
jgi:hypothetical protein